MSLFPRNVGRMKSGWEKGSGGVGNGVLFIDIVATTALDAAVFGGLTQSDCV